MIDPITRWFEAMKSNNKEVMRIVNLVQIIWPIRYPWPTETIREPGSEIVVHEFKNTLTEE